MPRAIWSGSIGFGLVSIPVRLFGATEPKDVRFHQFERGTGRRIHYRRVTSEAPAEPFALPPEHSPDDEPPGSSEARSAPERAFPVERASSRLDEGRDVPYEEVVKGFRVSEDEYVMVAPEELRSLQPERSRTIDIQDFVSLDDIDPVYFDRTYYVAPARGAGAEKPYGLLLRAMQKSRQVGIGTFVLSTKLHLAAIRPREDVLVLQTLFFGDEVRELAEIGFSASAAEPTQRELDVAVKLIDMLATEWDPSRYRDTYREQVLELIRSKAPRRTFEPEHAEPASGGIGVADLMAALQASVEAARKGSPAAPKRRTGRRKTG